MDKIEETAATAVSNLKVLLANRLDDVILLAAGVLLILFGHAL